MIGPKKKRSIAKKKQQKHTWMTYQLKKLKASTGIATCTNCHQPKRTHRVCSHCGFYAGKQVLTIKTKSSEKILDA